MTGTLKLLTVLILAILEKCSFQFLFAPLLQISRFYSELTKYNLKVQTRISGKNSILIEKNEIAEVTLPTSPNSDQKLLTAIFHMRADLNRITTLDPVTRWHL